METLTMPGLEFLDRFALHVLPHQFRRLRYAGILGQSKRGTLLATCRRLLADRVNAMSPVVETPPDVATAKSTKAGEAEERVEQQPPSVCPRCRARSFTFIECHDPERHGPRSQPSRRTASIVVTRPAAAPPVVPVLEDRAQVVPP